MLGILSKISDLANRLTFGLVIGFFTVVIVSTVVQVFFRYVVNHSFSWTEESARFAFIWLNMMGACVCVKRGSHAAVTILLDFLPGLAKRTVQTGLHLLILFASGLMFSQGIKMVMVALPQPSPALAIPMGLVYLSVPVGGLIIALHTLAALSALWVSGEGKGASCPGS